MFYSNIDVSSIIPTHLEHIINNQNIAEQTEEVCGICHEAIGTQHKTPHQVASKFDTVILSCTHTFHYECLKLACLNHKQSKYGRECALCRKMYQPIPKPINDTYESKFHKNIKHYDKQFPNLGVIQWDTILAGEKVYILSLIHI